MNHSSPIVQDGFARARLGARANAVVPGRRESDAGGAAT